MNQNLYKDSYFDRSEVSNSDLTAIKLLLHPIDLPDYVEAYKFGKLLDAMITENYRVDYFNRTCDGEKYFKPDFNVAEDMKRAFYSDPFCLTMIAGADFQHVKTKRMTINYNGYEFTIETRCKWDIWQHNQRFGGDIKSTTATTQKQFDAAVKYFDYDRQRAWYMDVSDSDEDVIIGISKTKTKNEKHKIFKVFVDRDSDIYKNGKSKYEYLALKWYLLNA